MFVIVIVIVVTRTMVNIIFTYVIAYFQDWNNTLFAQSMPSVTFQSVKSSAEHQGRFVPCLFDSHFN